MPANIEDESTQLATGGVDILFTGADAKVYQLNIDLGNMVGGDTVVVTVEVKVESAGSFIVMWQETYSGAQSAPDILQVSRPTPSPFEVRCSIEQTAGTNRNYDWSVVSLSTCTVESSGTIALDGTEQTIADIQTNRTMTMLTDHGNQIGGDTVVLRVKSVARTAGVLRTVFDVALAGVLVAPDISQMPVPIVAPTQWVATIEQTGGVNHNVPFVAVSIAA